MIDNIKPKREGMKMEITEKTTSFFEKLKEASGQYLPADIKTPSAQRMMLQQLAEVIPPVTACIRKAERDYWPAVDKGEMPIEKAIVFCSADVNHIIRITVVENLNLEGQTEESLLKTWAIMDYYCGVVSAKMGAPLKSLVERFTDILQEKMETRQKVEELAAMISAMEQLEEEKTAPIEVTASEPVKEITGIAGGNEKSGKGKIKWMLLSLVAVAALVVAMLPTMNKATKVEKQIESLGIVTLSSGEAIAAAEESYEALNENQKSKVENYGVLLEARLSYDCKVTEKSIDDIGKVTMESDEAITAAEELYDALPSAGKDRISNVKTMKEARKEHARLTRAVDTAVKNIKNIGKVDLSSAEKIRLARNSYDALEKDNLQSYVKEEAKILIAAENAYAECKTKDLLQKATALYEAGSYEEALVKLNELISDYPASASAKNAKDTAQKCRETLAEKAFNRGDLHTAMKYLKEMDASYAKTDAVKTLKEKVISKLTSARPRNGNVFTDKVGWGWCKLTVTASTWDLCVKIVSTENPANYSMVYVRAGESTEISVKDGSYDVYVTSGEYWYNKDIGFGDDAKYQQISGKLNTNSWRSGSYVYYYKYDLNLAKTSQSDFTLRDSSAKDFWK